MGETKCLCRACIPSMPSVRTHPYSASDWLWPRYFILTSYISLSMPKPNQSARYQGIFIRPPQHGNLVSPLISHWCHWITVFQKPMQIQTRGLLLHWVTCPLSENNMSNVYSEINLWLHFQSLWRVAPCEADNMHWQAVLHLCCSASLTSWMEETTLCSSQWRTVNQFMVWLLNGFLIVFRQQRSSMVVA